MNGFRLCHLQRSYFEIKAGICQMLGVLAIIDRPSIFVLFAGTEKHTTRIVSIRFTCLINSFFLYLQSGRFPSRSHQFHDPWPISSWELKQRKKPCTSGFQVDFGILVSMDDSPHRKMNHQSEINSNNILLGRIPSQYCASFVPQMPRFKLVMLLANDPQLISPFNPKSRGFSSSFPVKLCKNVI